MAVAFRPLQPESVRLGPRRALAQELVAFHQPEHTVSDHYRTLLGAISEQFTAGVPQVLLFTASASEAGTTTVLLNLAVTFARQGKLRVAVIDANLARPAVAQRLGLPTVPGLTETLTRTTPLARAIQETGQTNLLALTAGHVKATEQISASEAELSAMFEELREHFDLILVDAPCWDGKESLLRLSSICDGIYLVTPQAQADAPESGKFVHSIRRQLAGLKCQCAGSILTSH